MLMSLDTETTGLDLMHGAKPFLITTCDDRNKPDSIQFWEWDVDPLTRQPIIPEGDIEEILERIDSAEIIYGHNIKYDYRALLTIGIQLPWNKVRDTMAAAHLLDSNASTTGGKRNLTALCFTYLGEDIEHYELKIKETTRKYRDIAKKQHPDWDIADEGKPHMPSVDGSSKRDEDKPWKNDMWLPRVFDKNNTDCAKYANTDSDRTLKLALEMERIIKQRGLWNIYLNDQHLPRVAAELEQYGVTVIGEYTEQTIKNYKDYIEESEATLIAIAAEYDHELELAQGAAINDNMRDFFYGKQHQVCPRCDYRKRIKHWNGEKVDYNLVCPKCAKGGRRKVGVQQPLKVEQQNNLYLDVINSPKSGNASLDKEAIREYLDLLDGDAYDFVRLLRDKRKHDTDVGYMESYRRFWIPVPGKLGYYRIHPSLNPFGTDHRRWSSNSPNLQNVSTQDEECEDCEGRGCTLCFGTGHSRLSVRNCFGPAPGREWWDLDYKNIEKRIPAYESGEPKLIEIFENPNSPPYWGSDHNLLASILFPEMYYQDVCPKCLDISPRCNQCQPKICLSLINGGFKKKYLQKYKKTKNTNFAETYGCGSAKADATSGVVGTLNLIARNLPELAKLKSKYLRDAKKTGWVETLPNRRIDPKRGYPILASRTEDGGVLSTTPFNYHVSGTACECKNEGLIRCVDQCAKWRREGFDAHVDLEIHDSIKFDFPKGKDKYENLERVLILKGLMEQSGQDLIPVIPTPVDISYHPVCWAVGESVL